MFIENSDAFKVWLSSVLEPLCDADPEALAKYVFALVKKDKPLEELRECMIEQLDVFLQSETKPFVELLFKTLDSQEYLNNSHVIPNTNPPNPNTTQTLIKRDGIGASPKPEATLIVKEIKPIIPVSTLPNLSEAINGAVAVKTKNDETLAAAAAAATTVAAMTMTTMAAAAAATTTTTTTTATAKRDLRKSDSEKDELTSRGRSTRTSMRHRSSSRNRSRSRSWDRTGKRSRSRDRSPRIERRDRSRPWRNKSPPRRYDRERRRSRSGSPRIRSRSRSPRHSSYRIGGRYRNRSPPQRSISRSRSRSNERTTSSSMITTTTTRHDKIDKKIIEKDDNSGGATPTQDSNHGDTDMRLINTTQSIQSVVSAGEGFMGPGKRRCRDFDEKGYCMRGEMCPYDHGVDPVVLEDTALSRVLTFGPNGAPQVVGADGAVVVAPPPPPGSVPAGGGSSGSGGGPGGVSGGGGGGPPGLMNPQMVGGMLAVMPGGFHQRATMIHEYNPSAPGMLYHHRPGFRPRGPPPLRGGVLSLPPPPPHNNGGPPFGGQSIIQRELISVPVMDGPNMNMMGGGGGGGMYKRRPDYMGHQDGGSQPPPMKKRAGGFDFNRLGPRAGQNVKNPANCSLELKKVPRGLNNITHLNNHFGKFGKIVNIQVCFEGDPEGAIVTFSSHAEANAAYRSTEAVLNNRFIKVFWHTTNNSNNNNAGENIPPPLQTNNGQQQQQQQQQQRGPAKERLGQPVVNTNKVLNLVQPKASDENEEKSGSATANNITNNNNNNNSKKSNVYVPSLVKQKEDSKALANAAIVKNQEILAAKEQLKKKHEEKRKEALKITQDLRKRKQELLEKQLAQQKLLIEKLEKTNPSGQQRELLMSTIKTVQESIESIRKDMLSQTVVPVTVAGVAAGGPPIALPPRKSKEEAQREVLDAELDLITRQQEGGDTSELQRRLLELRAQAYNLTKAVGGGAGLGALGGGISRRGRGAGLRGARHHHNHHHFHLMTKNNMSLDNTTKRTNTSITGTGIGIGTATSSHATTNKKTVIDHRPTRLLVSGYEADEYESVLAHFSQYGEICEYVMDDSTPSIILSYRTRKEAEIAVLKGKHFQDRTLSVTWCTDIQYNTVQRATNSTTVTLVSNNNEQSVVSASASTAAEVTGTVASATDPQESVTLDEQNHQQQQQQQQQQKTITPEVSAIEMVKNKQENDVDVDEEVTLNTTEDQLLEGDDENISGEQLGAELSEEVLLQDDEEDLEEDEERSWRR